MAKVSAEHSQGMQLLFAVAFGLAFGAVVITVMLMLFAFVLTMGDFSKSAAIPFSSVAVAVGTFVASIVASKKYGRMGLAMGLITAFVLFSLLSIVSVIVSDSDISLLILIRFAIVMLSGAIGGIMGVNMGNKRKFI